MALMPPAAIEISPNRPRDWSFSASQLTLSLLDSTPPSRLTSLHDSDK